MFFKRAALTASLLAASCGLCAFDLQYGSFFKVQHISVQDGRPLLPLARGKYANLRVLDEGTFLFLQKCSARLCAQPANRAEPQIFDLRSALTRPGMWIAQVSFGGQWLITFLIFQHKDGYDVVEPQDFSFLDLRLRRQVHDMLAQAAAAFGQDESAQTQETK